MESGDIPTIGVWMKKLVFLVILVIMAIFWHCVYFKTQPMHKILMPVNINLSAYKNYVSLKV